MKRTTPTQILIMLVAALAVLLATCTPGARMSVAQSQLQRVSSPNVPDADLQALVAGNNAFAFDLYHILRSGNGNLFFSPYSISTALAMTYAGARGETEQQMADTLHFTLPQERLHLAFDALDLSLPREASGAGTGEEETFRLHVANSLWGQHGYAFRSEFLDLLAQNYGAGLRLVDFASAPEPARLAINEWVRDQTENKINDIIPEGVVTHDTRLVLANAIYFKADWRFPFPENNTHSAPFHLLNGGEVSVQVMSMSRPEEVIPSAEALRYAQEMGYQAVELLYDGERMSMMLIVPDLGTFAEFESALDYERVDAILAGMAPACVQVAMPRFDFESAFSMSRVLAEMGMPDAVTPEKADFSGMDGTHTLFISDVIHKSFVAVDERGTEASAATIVAVPVEGFECNDVVELTLDRPFVFLIRDLDTGSILFLGRVLNPAE